ncbi:MAG: PEP-CTERM sorting domain-containing protein [Planctomycetota bacterium]
MIRHFVLAAFVLAVFPPIGHAEVVLDQSHDAVTGTPGTPGTVMKDTSSPQSQTFTVGVTGILDSIDLQVGNSNPVGDLFLELLETSGGVPTPSSLGSVTVDASTFVPGAPAITYVNVPVSHLGIAVETGDVLAIELSTDDSNGYVWRYDLDGYAGGRNYFRIGDTHGTTIGSLDYGFQTFVTAIPEPGALVPLLTLVGMLTLRKRQR